MDSIDNIYIYKRKYELDDGDPIFYHCSGRRMTMRRIAATAAARNIIDGTGGRYIPA